MTIPTYTTRITEVDGKITAWVDMNGQPCIEQPNAPDKLNSGSNWNSVEEAQAWATTHADELTQAAVAYEAELQAKAEKEAQETAARQAILENATKVDEIHAMLKQLTSNN